MNEAERRKFIIVSFVVSCVVSTITPLVFLMGFDENVFIIAVFAITYVILILCGLKFLPEIDIGDDRGVQRLIKETTPE